MNLLHACGGSGDKIVSKFLPEIPPVDVTILKVFVVHLRVCTVLQTKYQSLPEAKKVVLCLSAHGISGLCIVCIRMRANVSAPVRPKASLPLLQNCAAGLWGIVAKLLQCGCMTVGYLVVFLPAHDWLQDMVAGPTFAIGAYFHFLHNGLQSFLRMRERENVLMKQFFNNESL